MGRVQGTTKTLSCLGLVKKMTIDKDKIIANLKQVFDPEIPINVYDLGLIYDIDINEKDSIVTITHTLTSAWCGFADEITENIRQADGSNAGENTQIASGE